MRGNRHVLSHTRRVQTSAILLLLRPFPQLAIMDSGDWKTVSLHYMRDVIRTSITKQSIDTVFRPTLLIAASEDALAIARILRSELQAKTSQCLPILTSKLQLFDDSNPYRGEVTSAWQGTFSGQHVLLVDKADQTRASIVSYLTSLQQGVIAEQASSVAEWEQPQLAVFVMHNKNVPKTANLPEGVIEFVGAESDDVHIAYGKRPHHTISYHITTHHTISHHVHFMIF